ncbi:protein PRRC1-A-like [Argonauta hians]
MMEEVFTDQPTEMLEKLESSAQIAHQLQEAAQTDVISSAGGNGNGSSVSPVLSSLSSSLSSSFTEGSTIFPTTTDVSSPVSSQGTPSLTTAASYAVTQANTVDSLMSGSTVSHPSPSSIHGKAFGSDNIETPTIPRTGSPTLPQQLQTQQPQPSQQQQQQLPQQQQQHDSTQQPQGSLFGWLSGNSFVSKVVEKTKSSMESVITTLDPQMKEYIKSGGDVDIIVASSKEVKVGPIREAMQQAFGRATVIGRDSDASTAAQPVGYAAALRGAQERISRLRQQDDISSKQTVVAIEGFIVELQTDSWFEMSCLLLQDPTHDITVSTYSQPTPIPTPYVLTAKDRTPSDYPLRWSGLAVTIGQVVEEAQPHIGRSNWQLALAGVSRYQSLSLAAQVLAYLYKQQYPTSYIS